MFPRRFRASRSRVRVLAERLAAESAGPWPPARGTLLLFSPLRPRGGCLEYLKAPALGWVGEVGDALETQAGASPRDIWVPPTSTPSGSADPSPQPGSSRKSPALWIQRSQTFGTFECGPYCPRASIPLPPPLPASPDWPDPLTLDGRPRGQSVRTCSPHRLHAPTPQPGGGAAVELARRWVPESLTLLPQLAGP